MPRQRKRAKSGDGSTFSAGHGSVDAKYTGCKSSPAPLFCVRSIDQRLQAGPSRCKVRRGLDPTTDQWGLFRNSGLQVPAAYCLRLPTAKFGIKASQPQKGSKNTLQPRDSPRYPSSKPWVYKQQQQQRQQQLRAAMPVAMEHKGAPTMTMLSKLWPYKRSCHQKADVQPQPPSPLPPPSSRTATVTTTTPTYMIRHIRNILILIGSTTNINPVALALGGCTE